jgi:ATP-dependent DNA helicase RecG
VSGDILGAKLASVLGGRTADALRKGLGLVTVSDLVRDYPRRYAERGELTDLSTLREGEQVTVLAEVKSVTVRPMRQRRGTILEAVIGDGQGTLSLTFFNQKWREGQLKVGRRGLFAGQVSQFQGKKQLAHPEFELLPEGVDDDPLATLSFAGALIPIYPASKSVTSWQVNKALDTVLPQLGELPDPLPEDLRRAHGFMSLSDALWAIHRPTSRDDVRAAVDRLRFEEAFVLQVLLAQRRVELMALPATRRCPSGSSRTWPRSTRCTGCCRVTSAAARPSWRCAPCCGWSTQGGRRPCWRPPRCSRRSTSARSRRCSDL